MTTQPVTVDEEQFLREFPPGTAFQVRVEGEPLESFLGKSRCAYFEWLYGEKQEGQLASFTVAYQSTQPIVLSAAGKSAAVSPRRVRAYLAPALERTYAPGDEAAPEVVKEYLAEGNESAYVAEFCLEVGKSYHAVVHQDSYHLPPRGPMDAPEHARRLVLRLSDQPFEEGRPAVEMTPAYRGWSY